MGKFAVIDTETNWSDQVMSIGIVIADEITFSPVDIRYYAIVFFKRIGRHCKLKIIKICVY